VNTFLSAYIQTALWSSTEYAYGECPCCGKRALLNRLPEPEFDQVPMCSAPGCGVPNRDCQPDPMDSNYSENDLAPETLAKMSSDCDKFLADNSATIQAAIDTGEVKCGPDFDEWGRAGHDFWLTREGHGAGFWDGDWPEPMATALTAAAKSFGERPPYAGDDGRLYS
jgi:hypothetical protein